MIFIIVPLRLQMRNQNLPDPNNVKHRHTWDTAFGPFLMVQIITFAFAEPFLPAAPGPDCIASDLHVTQFLQKLSSILYELKIVIYLIYLALLLPLPPPLTLTLTCSCEMLMMQWKIVFT